MRIALDAFGSDRAPYPEVEGAVLALKENVCQEIFLVGNQTSLAAELGKYYYPKERLHIVHAEEVITMRDAAGLSARSKKDSSLVKTVRLFKDGMVDAAVSAGNTGAVVAASLFAYGRIKGVERPGIAITLPTMADPSIILDVGANVDCTPNHLFQYAELGSLYSKFFYNKEKPRVALLNIGEEDSKGNELTKAVYAGLTKNPAVNFVGNIEGKELLIGNADVVVCDGFVGNVMLKTVEGAAVSIFKMMRDRFQRDWVAKFGALLMLPVFTYMRKKMDHTEYGGGLLVGLDGLSIIAHGSSNAKAIKNAVRFAARIAESGFLEHCRTHFAAKA